MSALGRLFEKSSTEILLFSTASLRFVLANKGALQNLGYTEEELFTMSPLDIKPEHTAETFDKLVQPLQHSMDSTVQFQTKHQRKNGTTYDANIVLQRMAYQDSDVYVAFVLDVSDRIRSAEMIENLFSLSPVAQLLFDERGVIECNEEVLRLLRMTNKDELLGRHPGEFSPEFQPCGERSDVMAQPIIEETYRTGFNRFEWLHVRADGTEFITEITFWRVRLETGDPLLVIWNNITDRKNYETQLITTQDRFARLKIAPSWHRQLGRLCDGRLCQFAARRIVRSPSNDEGTHPVNGKNFGRLTGLFAGRTQSRRDGRCVHP